MSMGYYTVKKKVKIVGTFDSSHNEVSPRLCLPGFRGVYEETDCFQSLLQTTRWSKYDRNKL
jgi:hypothetical protein